MPTNCTNIMRRRFFSETNPSAAAVPHSAAQRTAPRSHPPGSTTRRHLRSGRLSFSGTPRSRPQPPHRLLPSAAEQRPATMAPRGEWVVRRLMSRGNTLPRVSCHQPRRRMHPARRNRTPWQATHHPPLTVRPLPLPANHEQVKMRPQCT